MIILGIESSCDETAASILTNRQNRIKILSNIVASSAKLQAKYGGIIPEQAAREQIKSIIPVLQTSLDEARLKPSDIDAIAVTAGPGLIGSLLVGVETAKTLSLVWNKPLIPVNHLVGHFYANWINLEDTKQDTPTFPCIGLLVSGGHTDLVLFKNHGKFTYLGGTRDDASGECFDKCARLLNLPYPGGPEISKLAKTGDPTKFKLPKPMWSSKDYDFSFSGLKTAVANLISSNNEIATSQSLKADLASSIERSIVDILVKKTIQAAQNNEVEKIMIAGGVASNQTLVQTLKQAAQTTLINSIIYTPPPYLCTDNASMIASAAFFINPIKDPLLLQANPNLSLAY